MAPRIISSVFSSVLFPKHASFGVDRFFRLCVYLRLNVFLNYRASTYAGFFQDPASVSTVCPMDMLYNIQKEDISSAVCTDSLFPFWLSLAVLLFSMVTLEWPQAFGASRFTRTRFFHNYTMGFLEAVWYLAFLLSLDKCCVKNKVPSVKNPEVYG